MPDVLAAADKPVVGRGTPPEVHVGRGRVGLMRLQMHFQEQLVRAVCAVQALSGIANRCHRKHSNDGSHCDARHQNRKLRLHSPPSLPISCHLRCHAKTGVSLRGRHSLAP
eukprot:2229117-Rhodomonas_salina.1